jgi:DNA-binding XRE family transcriptional regulator
MKRRLNTPNDAFKDICFSRYTKLFNERWKRLKRMAVMTTLKEKLNQLSPERRAKVQARAGQLMAEELSLRDLRLARKLTQEKMAELLQIRQEGVSRLEKRSDLHLSTLRQVIQAMGGELRLVVEFPDRPPVILSGFQEVEELA